jgi:hypothetical protein
VSGNRELTGDVLTFARLALLQLAQPMGVTDAQVDAEWTSGALSEAARWRLAWQGDPTWRNYHSAWGELATILAARSDRNNLGLMARAWPAVVLVCLLYQDVGPELVRAIAPFGKLEERINE